MIERARNLFGVSFSIGIVAAICPRASEALAGTHAELHDWVLDQAAVHVDETGWRTAGASRVLWTLTTPAAALFQIVKHTQAVRRGCDALRRRGGPSPHRRRPVPTAIRNLVTSRGISRGGLRGLFRPV